MNIKRYVARTSREALAMVRAELGDDAVVLKNRSVPEGVEILEFRTADAFDIRFKGNTAAFWDKIVDGLRKEKPGWEGQRKPTELVGAK